LPTGVNTIVASRGVAVEGDHGAQIHLASTSPLNTRQTRAASPAANGTSRPERRRLDRLQASPRLQVTTRLHFLDPAWLVVQAENDLVDFRDLLQQVELKLQERPVENRDDGFGCVNRKRTQSRALAPSEENRLHTSHR
jgi:hypothetical protein